jgi:hypothetical protein
LEKRGSASLRVLKLDELDIAINSLKVSGNNHAFFLSASGEWVVFNMSISTNADFMSRINRSLKSIFYRELVLILQWKRSSFMEFVYTVTHKFTGAEIH